MIRAMKMPHSMLDLKIWAGYRTILAKPLAMLREEPFVNLNQLPCRAYQKYIRDGGRHPD